MSPADGRTWSSLDADISSARQDWRLESFCPDRLRGRLLLLLGEPRSMGIDPASIFVASGAAHRPSQTDHSPVSCTHSSKGSLLLQLGGPLCASGDPAFDFTKAGTPK